MAREQFNNNSGSSQFFVLLKESEITPTGLNLLDGSYSTFGYVVEGAEFLGDLRPGDKIVGARVVDGMDNLKAGDPNAPLPEFDEVSRCQNASLALPARAGVRGSVARLAPRRGAVGWAYLSLTRVRSFVRATAMRCQFGGLL